MTKFLITGMGGDMAQSISRIIKSEFNNSHIIGVDVSTRNAARKFCDDFSLAPYANDKSYLDFILSNIEKNKIDFFIPCTEHELRVLALIPNDHDLWKRTIVCSKDILQTCLDKLETFKFLSSHKIPVPWFTEDSKLIKSFPCIYKKKSSSGSRDIFKISNSEEASFLQNYSPNGLFQEYLKADDQEYTCSIFKWNDGTFQTIQLLRTLTGGATSWAEVANDPSIEKLCLDIANIFNLKGSLNIQLRMTEKGPMIFEINPRFSSTVYMRHLLGFKDLVWSIKKMQGLNMGTINNIPSGTQAAKYSEVYLVN